MVMRASMVAACVLTSIVTVCSMFLMECAACTRYEYSFKSKGLVFLGILQIISGLTVICIVTVYATLIVRQFDLVAGIFATNSAMTGVQVRMTIGPTIWMGWCTGVGGVVTGILWISVRVTDKNEIIEANRFFEECAYHVEGKLNVPYQMRLNDQRNQRNSIDDIRDVNRDARYRKSSRSSSYSRRERDRDRDRDRNRSNDDRRSLSRSYYSQTPSRSQSYAGTKSADKIYNTGLTEGIRLSNLNNETNLQAQKYMLNNQKETEKLMRLEIDNLKKENQVKTLELFERNAENRKLRVKASLASESIRGNTMSESINTKNTFLSEYTSEHTPLAISSNQRTKAETSNMTMTLDLSSRKIRQNNQNQKYYQTHKPHQPVTDDLSSKDSYVKKYLQTYQTVGDDMRRKSNLRKGDDGGLYV